MISGWLGSMCVCFSVRNQVYCHYFAVAVIKLTKIVRFFFPVEEKSCVFSVSLGKNTPQSESSCFLPSEESYAFSAFLTFFPHPPRRWEQTIPLSHICVWRVSQTLYFCSVTLTESQKTRGAGARRNGFTTCFLFGLYWISVMVPGWMIIRGSLSWTSQTWVKILHFSCETWPLKIKKRDRLFLHLRS